MVMKEKNEINWMDTCHERSEMYSLFILNVGLCQYADQTLVDVCVCVRFLFSAIENSPFISHVV